MAQGCRLSATLLVAADIKNFSHLPDTDIENGGFRGLLGIEKMMKCSTLCSNNSEPYFRACVVEKVTNRVLLPGKFTLASV